ncbi:EEF1A lysine methyltransferase 4-like [Oryza brachyantha]|uniref:EEF1A lysine methyltransferase 4-like n=1 Tax=Oryza brachyantha TaxID=4533 RepID=UPI001ADC181A|nr:EEF1A lysine methyltransferase 4-like [Oryza brachyantha]
MAMPSSSSSRPSPIRRLLSSLALSPPPPPRAEAPTPAAAAMSSSPSGGGVDNDDEEEGTGRSEGSGAEGGGGGRALSYGEAEYWDARYVEEGGAPYDWYQRYAALRPFVRRFAPPDSRVLMIGCGSALMSEDMIDDGYTEIMNIDISSVVIEIMRKKHFNVPQLQYIEMDVRDMSEFCDESFDCAIDKGTLDSLMCGVDAPLSAAQMVLEVERLLKPGGVFMLITYGDPSVRVPHLNQPGCKWKIVLYILPRPGFKGKTKRSVLDPVPMTQSGRLPDGFAPEDPDSHYIYVCKKLQGSTGTSSPTIQHVNTQDTEE